jgi:hypothetical protein
LQQNDAAEKANAKANRSLVGSFIYLTNTRLDIVHSVNLISRFMNQPSKLIMQQQKEFFATCKAQRSLAFCTKNRMITILLVLLTVIGLDLLMIEKALPATFFA